ncbi:DUF748 domain-containing protein [Rhodohalobacter halophilus]|uniref:DUF748 domain-containing protein n=1 Tax=Rhodohalobacter halophilus TaxID=1812810 RepID=UPI00083F638E|nr:hypothetical protein [Rhodohalobacter halophilus]
MNRSIKLGLTGFIFVFVAAAVILTLSVDSIVKSGIENIGSEMTQTKVSVDGVSISLFSGKGSITGLKVANPDGFDKENAFTADEISIEVDIRSLFSDEMVVKQLEVISPSVIVEQQMPDNNLRKIMNSINQSSSDSASESMLVIEQFRMTDGTADLYTEIGGERSAQVEISEIELQDLGRGGARQSVEDVIQTIADRIVENSLRAAAQSGAEQIRDAIRDLF